MKGFNELKKDIHENPEIVKCFSNIKNEKEATEVALKLGYEVTEDELKYDKELKEDILEIVAGGGKGDANIRQDYVIVAEPGKYKNVDIDRETGEVKGYN